LQLLGEAHKAAAAGDRVIGSGGERQEEQECGSRQKRRSSESAATASSSPLHYDTQRERVLVALYKYESIELPLALHEDGGDELRHYTHTLRRENNQDLKFCLRE
jgi:hypothetical protein